MDAGNYKTLSADGLVKSGGGKLKSILCTAASGGPSLKVWDATSASGAVIVDTFTPVAGTNYVFGCWFSNGLYIDITNTVSVTVIYE